MKAHRHLSVKETFVRNPLSRSRERVGVRVRLPALQYPSLRPPTRPPPHRHSCEGRNSSFVPCHAKPPFSFQVVRVATLMRYSERISATPVIATKIAAAPPPYRHSCEGRNPVSDPVTRSRHFHSRYEGSNPHDIFRTKHSTSVIPNAFPPHLSFRTQRSGVRNLRCPFSQRSSVAGTTSMTTAGSRARDAPMHDILGTLPNT